MTWVSTNYYSLDLALFHKEIRRLEWTEGLWAPQVLKHDNSRPNFAGASYAAFDEIINGYTVKFPAGVERVDLVGSNNNIIDVLLYSGAGVVPTNSAGLQDLGTLLASAYGKEVVIDPLLGQVGISVPVGTYNKSVNNIPDAITIGLNVGLRRFMFLRSMAINEDLSDEYALVGDSPYNVLTCNPIADLTGCSIENLTVVGELDGLNILKDCILGAVTGVSGYIKECDFTSTMQIVGDTRIRQCYSAREGGLYPLLSILSGNVTVRDYHGSLGLADITSGTHSIGVEDGGRVVIESSCVGGTIHLRGDPFEIIDNSGPGCTVIDETGGNKTRAIHDANFRKRIYDSNTNTITIYAEDNVTPQYVFDVNADLSNITPQ